MQAKRLTSCDRSLPGGTAPCRSPSGATRVAAGKRSRSTHGSAAKNKRRDDTMVMQWTAIQPYQRIGDRREERSEGRRLQEEPERKHAIVRALQDRTNMSNKLPASLVLTESKRWGASGTRQSEETKTLPSAPVEMMQEVR